MTSLFTRLGAWFLEPPPPNVPGERQGEPAALAEPPAPTARFLPPNTAPRRRPPAAAPTRAASAAPTSAASAAPTRAASAAPTRAAPTSAASAAPTSAASAAPASSQASPAASWASAAVLGAPGHVVPLAAACAGELRTRARAAAALLCVWRPAASPHTAQGVDPVASPAGATTPGARRLAARLVAHDLAATACGRLAWLSLEQDAQAAAEQVRRCLRIAGGPVVLAVAGARPPAFEPLLAELELAVAVLAPDIDPALRDLALATLPARGRAVVSPLPPGPPRWAAMAGLARLRSLPREGA